MGIVLFLCILFAAASTVIFIKMAINLFKIRKNLKKVWIYTGIYIIGGRISLLVLIASIWLISQVADVIGVF